MLIAIADVETNGLDDGCLATEYAIATYDTLSKAIINCVSTLVPTSVDANETSKLTGITDLSIEACKRQNPIVYSGIAESIKNIFESCSFALAHNASFDKQFFTIPANWLCSMDDIDWKMDNPFAKPSTLVNLAVSYGVPIASSHRAINDVLILAAVLSKANDLDALIIDALEPKYRAVANVSYQRKDEAKSQGFKWDSQLKRWWRYANERQIKQFNDSGLEIDIIGEDA